MTKVPDNNSLIDFQMIKLQFGNDQEILKEFVSTYLMEWPNYIQNIESALSQSNSDEVFAAAHKFKGVFGNLYCQFVIQKIEQIEFAAKEKKMDVARSLLLEISPSLKKIHEILGAWLREKAA